MVRHATTLWRLCGGIAVGIVAGVLVGAGLGPAAGLLAGWATGAVVVVVWVLVVVWRMDAEQTRLHATQEDPGRHATRLISIVGSLASLGAVALVLVRSGQAPQMESYLLAAIAVYSVMASWALIQTDYMLRYARIYYAADPPGGISFNEHPDRPAYVDFAYFSVGLGMTYQVADTNVRTTAIRRIVIGQTLLAYLLGAVILATIINLVTSLA